MISEKLWKIFIFDTEIENNKERTSSGLSETVKNKIDFIAYCIHKDYPLVLELTILELFSKNEESSKMVQNRPKILSCPKKIKLEKNEKFSYWIISVKLIF